MELDKLDENNKSKAVLRSFWARLFNFDWKFGTFLILIVCIPRFILVLQANANGSYGAIGAIMFVSALAPFIFLTRNGQSYIGLIRTKRYQWLFMAFICGIMLSLILYYLGEILYGASYENWYVYIAKSYKIPAGLQAGDKRTMFLIMAAVGMTFSPIGEELFFRGIVHSSFAHALGEKRALIIDALAFSVTHISHFGLVFVNHGFTLYTVPMLIWVSSMFLVSVLFYYFKQRSGSLIGAVVCHAGFNLGMIFSIFYLL
jgi:membrane protease YdiL (CAAX protease family)